jgi:acyl-CoA thioester hydrolase
MDAFGHVNHAKTVTLLEEARVELLFTEAGRQGLLGMAEGMVVAKVGINYHAPVTHSARTLQVHLSVRDLRAASFRLDYSAYAGSMDPAVTAETLMVPYDLRAARPRRLSDAEQKFLAEWQLAAGSTEPEFGRA